MIPLVTASEGGKAQILNLLGFTYQNCNLKKRFPRLGWPKSFGIRYHGG